MAGLAVRDSLLVRFAAFVLLVVLWTVFAVAAWAEDAVVREAAAPKPAAAAASIADCIDETGDFATHGKNYSLVSTLINKCENACAPSSTASSSSSCDRRMS